jgi:type IV pilus assembly protein PilF
MNPLRALCLAVIAASCAGGPSREQVEEAQRAYELGVGLYQERNHPGAFDELLRAVRLDPDHAEAHLALGHLFLLRPDAEQAEHHFLEAIRANGASQMRSGLEADAKNSLGVLYIHARRFEEAVQLLRESARDLMNRDPAVAWTNLGWALFESGDQAGAIEAYDQALRMSPALCLAWYRLGQVRAAREEWEPAETALNHVLDVEDETCRRLQVGWRLRGEVRARLGHRAEAIQDLERCVELSPETEDGAACRRLLESQPAAGSDGDPQDQATEG